MPALEEQEPPATDIGAYKAIGVLDRTDSSTVLLAEAQGRKCVVKRIVKAETAQPEAMYVNEVRTLQALHARHPNIVSLLGVQDSEEKLEMIFEYCDEGSLRLVLERAEKKDRALRARLHGIWNDTTSVLVFLHAKRSAHLDIKTDNVLVGSHGARLCDFGTCVRVAPGQRVAGNFGTEGFKAPEVGSTGGFDAFLADVFSAGKVLDAILTVPGAIAAPLGFLVDMMIADDPADRPMMDTVRVMS